MSLNHIALVFACWILSAPLPAEEAAPFRPPAVPLVTHDPYFSVWSAHDRLTAGWTTHWTGTVQAMCGMARIEGKLFRFLGPGVAERRGRRADGPGEPPPMEQVGLEVLPTRTIARFEADGLRLTLTFTTPALPQDLEVLSRPVTYLSWEARSTDGRARAVKLYLDLTAEWAVNTPEQPVVWSRFRAAGLDLLRVGTRDQPVLGRSGDNLRIDWGHLYLAVPRGEGVETAIASDRAARRSFIEEGRLPGRDDLRMPRAANDQWPVLAAALDLGVVGEAPVARRVLIAYDDLFSIEYLNRRLRPYWRRKGMEAAEMLEAAEREYTALAERCQKFDEELMDGLRRAGGESYARLCALAHRQCLAAHKLVADFDGSPLHFSKENFSNGCIATVDVIYPAAPFFLALSPALLRAQLVPVLEYARSARWTFPFAPHDLGTYPLANGQVYGGGERSEENQMPVEESGNLLLLLAALARVEGNADFALRWWPLLSRWAEYLREKGLDPENQLCTDDFAGHLAHNTNLSLKAILALGGWGLLCEMAGKQDQAAEYRKTSQAMARRWVEMAQDGDHFRLAFDRPGTWSQKYNLVWDRLLGLDLFPSEVARKEMDFYRKMQGRYGLPLDNRSQYTKLDWVVWTGTLAETPEDFRALIEPAYLFAQETPDRVPLTDWYWTHDAKQRGFQARSVVGGIFIKLLADVQARRDRSR